MPQLVEHRLVAILHADVVGYSRLTELDEIGTHENLTTFLDFMSSAIEQFSGTLANAAGDALLAYFGTATDAVACAVSVQRAITKRNQYVSNEKRLDFRIGINLGDVIFDDHLFRRGPYGNTINVAVRLEGLAPPGGICVTDAIRAAVGNKLAVDYEFIGEQAIKNIEEPVRVHRVRAQPEAIIQPPHPRKSQQPASEAPKHTDRLDKAHISTSKMPVTGGLLLGRDSELAQLDASWDDPDINITELTAWGGVGKSTLVNHWLQRMAGRNYRGAKKVYAWSFYHQGTVDRITAADEFIVSALIWFGDPKPNDGSAREKAERLARFVRRERVLLILDGMEPLQFPPGPDEGRLVDDGLHTLLCELAIGHPGLCVVTSRLLVTDLDGFQHSLRRINVSPLTAAAGASLLRALYVNGSEEELRQASDEFDGHCLALTLLANYLNEAFDGDISRRDHVEALQEDTTHGGHAKRVLASYATWIRTPSELEILRLIGLFDRPAQSDAIEALRSQPIAGLTETINAVSDGEFNRAVSRLRRASLLAQRDAASPSTLDAHPLVRQFFREQLRSEFPQAWREGNACLFRHFKHCTTKVPTDLREMEPAFQAVIFGCRAGLEQQALHDVYLPQIMRGRDFYAANVLGCRGTLLSVLSQFFVGSTWSQPVESSSDREGLAPADQLLLLQHVRRLLTTTFGFDPPGIVQCAQKIKSLCQLLGDSGSLYSAIASDWMRALVNAPLPRAVSLADEMLKLGREQNDNRIRCGAYSCLANSEFFRGSFARAKEFAETGVALSQVASSRDAKTAEITCRCFEALSLWHLGLPDLALERIGQAVAQARLLPSAHTLAVALHFDGYINHFCGLAERASETAANLMDLSRTNGFRFWLAGSYVQFGWARCLLGDREDGLRFLEVGIREWRAAGAKLIVPYWLAMASEGYKALGRNSESLLFVEEGLASVDSRGENWWKADLMRLKGVLFRELGERSKAREWFEKAIGLALGQGSQSLALRAAIELALTTDDPSRMSDVNARVRRVYDSISHAFETDDLKQARLIISRKH